MTHNQDNVFIQVLACVLRYTTPASKDNEFIYWVFSNTLRFAKNQNQVLQVSELNTQIKTNYQATLFILAKFDWGKDRSTHTISNNFNVNAAD